MRMRLVYFLHPHLFNGWPLLFFFSYQILVIRFKTFLCDITHKILYLSYFNISGTTIRKDGRLKSVKNLMAT